MEPIDEYIERLNEPAIRSYWRKVHGLDDDSEADPAFHGSKVSEEQVLAAEEALGLALPPSYRKLVTSTEPTDGVYFVYWVNDTQPFEADIVRSNKTIAGPFHQFLIKVVAPDGGDEYCFDTRYPDDRGEYPIVFWDHEIHDEESTDCEKVANDLGEFLLGCLGGEGSE